MDNSATEFAYNDLIEQVFIHPIRSVLIVDDQYPTVEEHLFVSEHASQEQMNEDVIKKLAHYQGKTWRTSPQRVASVVKCFRDRKWIVDFHDGHCLDPNEFKDIIGHLHQSDLLILDYQLDGISKGGEKCIAAVEHLACNSQFNLVVIHTDHESPEGVFIEILLSLLPPFPDFGVTEKLTNKVRDALEEWEDEDEDIVKKIMDSVDAGLYLRARSNFVATSRKIAGHESEYFHRFISLYKDKPATVAISIVELFKWSILNFEKSINEKLCKRENVVTPTWSFGGAGENWIRTDKIFLTVSSKRDDPDLAVALTQALNAWKPLPPRLVLGKIRAELGKMGVAAEDSFLKNKHLQAAWYYKLLSCRADGVKTEIQKTIQEYWQGISGGLESDLIEFTSSLMKAEEREGKSLNSTINDHFKIDFDIESQRLDAVLRLNVQSCSLKPYGWHLATGHIVKIRNEYWLCLTPACDLIPEQKNSGRFDRMKTAMPFRAVQLRLYGNPKDALKSVNGNLEFFVELEGKVFAFGFLPPPSDSSDIAPNPVWDELFAKNHGRLPTSGKLAIEVGRLQWDDGNGGSLSVHWAEGEVVGQIRYEYAINLMQRLGFTLSRVGLDFVQ